MNNILQTLLIVSYFRYFIDIPMGKFSLKMLKTLNINTAFFMDARSHGKFGFMIVTPQGYTCTFVKII
jgi:hypothetical protein